jgi:asparagine synthase (glutamine-hydrolysing)
MFVSVYLGQPQGADAWRAAVRNHAGWLGGALRVSIDGRLIDAETLLEVAWIHVGPPGAAYRLREAGDWFLIGACGEMPCALLAARDREGLARAAVRRADNVPTIAVHRASGEVLGVVPLTSPHPLLFAALPGDNGRNHVFGDDLRFFRRLTAAHVDDRALYALAQFGAVPAPWTLFREVSRVPNGHLLRLPGGTFTPIYGLADAAQDAGPALGDPAAQVERALQTQLRDVASPATLFFSGGVDSGLLAAQWRRLGGDRSAKAINYGFGPDDGESRLAQTMAAHLGFEVRRINHDPGAVTDVIARVGRDYSFPFGDISVVPTNLLVHAAANMMPLGSTVLEGTGADGAFGFGATYPFWRSIYAAPTFVRRGVRALYRAAQLWRRDNRPVYALRFVAKSAGLALPQAVIAQHSLDGMALHSTPEMRRDLADTVRTTMEALAAGRPPADAIALLDLIWVCGGRMAPKSFDPLRCRGLMPRYPYLEPTMLAVSASLAPAEKWPGGERKAPLKALLARDVPADWVYRTKHGFTPPEGEILSTPASQDLLHSVVLAPGGPLAGLCDLAVIRRFATLAREERPLGSGVHDLLWVLLFTAAWLEQVPRGTTPVVRAPHPATAGVLP